MRIGYARVSTDEQTLQSQEDALFKAGCELVYLETASARTRARPELERMLQELNPDDVVVVWKTDRLARSVLDFHALIQEIEGVGAHFESITEPFDTSTPAGRMILSVLATFAEYEREMNANRTRAGLEAAKAKGVKLGRPLRFTHTQIEAIRQMYKEGKSYAEIARIFRAHRATIARIVRREGAYA